WCSWTRGSSGRRAAGPPDARGWGPRRSGGPTSSAERAGLPDRCQRRHWLRPRPDRPRGTRRPGSGRDGRRRPARARAGGGREWGVGAVAPAGRTGGRPSAPGGATATTAPPPQIAEERRVTKAAPLVYPPRAENTAPSTATPNTPPSSRMALFAPEAMP